MQTFNTTDSKVARRCRYDQHRGKKTTVTVVGIARHRIGPFRHGSSVQQPEALAHHGHRQVEHRGLTGANTR
jgi:hypothetical protein